jgi:hypothetical protein
MNEEKEKLMEDLNKPMDQPLDPTPVVTADVVSPKPDKPGFNWKRSLVTIAIVLLTALVVGGTTWYIMNTNSNSINTSNNSTINAMQTNINNLKNQITALNKKVTSTQTTTTSTSTAATTLTNDQIFAQVAAQFGLTKSTLSYFRIFGQDKVQYSLNTSEDGTVYAYKANGTWIKLVGGTDMQDCSAYPNVPTNYLPPCVSSSGATLYTNTDGSSTNYPASSMVSYIGQ